MLLLVGAAGEGPGFDGWARGCFVRPRAFSFLGGWLWFRVSGDQQSGKTRPGGTPPPPLGQGLVPLCPGEWESGRVGEWERPLSGSWADRQTTCHSPVRPGHLCRYPAATEGIPGRCQATLHQREGCGTVNRQDAKVAERGKRQFLTQRGAEVTEEAQRGVVGGPVGWLMGRPGEGWPGAWVPCAPVIQGTSHGGVVGPGERLRCSPFPLASLAAWRFHLDGNPGGGGREFPHGVHVSAGGAVRGLGAWSALAAGRGRSGYPKVLTVGRPRRSRSAWKASISS